MESGLTTLPVGRCAARLGTADPRFRSVQRVLPAAGRLVTTQQDCHRLPLLTGDFSAYSSANNG